MNSIRIILILLICLLPRQILHAQEVEEIPMIRYSPEYVFRDGLFLSIDDVRNNDPIPLARIVSDRYTYDEAFFNELIIKKEIILYDDAGVKAFLKTREIWGYALKGRLYIMVGGRFQRIHLLGSISHFVASETTHEKKYFAEEDTSSHYTTTQDLYRHFYHNNYYYRTLRAEGEICLFDFESNTLVKYDPVALGKLLERDSLLFSEYEPLRKREKNNRMAEFIRRYNENHPLYFPEETDY
jgi:hypothetical protein